MKKAKATTDVAAPAADGDALAALFDRLHHVPALFVYFTVATPDDVNVAAIFAVIKVSDRFL